MIRARLLPLFLISGAAVGYETALTRYFAVAKWSEYGYWVISIVMVGFAFSGVTMALARTAFLRRAAWLLTWLPVALIATAAAGYWATTANPFNPLQLQNAATYGPQIGNIALYYAGLLPFFYLTGLYISLCFVLNDDRVGRVYGADLLGAGAGAALVLALMNVIHPFLLVPALLVPLFVASLFGPAGAGRGRAALAGVLALAGSEVVLLLAGQAAYNDFKAIYAPLHVQNSRVLAEVQSPRGLYALLDDFTERVDTDVSNNAGLMNVPGPPTAYGLYRDGARIAALPKPGALDTGYAPAALDALPYVLRPHARVLLAGSPPAGSASAEALTLGARAGGRCLEPDPVVLATHCVGGWAARCHWRPTHARHGCPPDSPLAAARRANGYRPGRHLGRLPRCVRGEQRPRITAEALTADLRRAEPRAASSPCRCRSGNSRSMRCGCWRRCAGRCWPAGVAGPREATVVVYRSAWNVRILLSQREPWRCRTASPRFGAGATAAPSTCRTTPGIDVAAARAGLYNDLPAVSFEDGVGHVWRRVGGCHRRRGGGGAAAAMPSGVGCGVLAGPGDAGPAGLLRRAAPVPPGHDPEVGWKSCRSRRSGNW